MRTGNTKILNVLAKYLLFCTLLSSCYSSTEFRDKKSQIDELITIDKINDSIKIVKLGYDAVTGILTQDGIVVIDAGISNSLTQKYRAIIEKELKVNHFAYLINTHGHHDHTGGNQVFSDAEIIGHEKCKIEISESQKDQAKVKSNYLKITQQYEKKLQNLDSGTVDWKAACCQKYRYQCAAEDMLNSRKIMLPTKTFRDSMHINVGNVNIDMMYVGKAHSESDILIHIPEKKILMVGDLFSGGGIIHIQYKDKYDVKRWLKVKKWITDRMNRINIVIGGHGEIMGKEDIGYFLEWIENEIGETL